MTEIPFEAKRIIDEAFVTVRAHPQHQCSWRQRQAFYRQLGSVSDRAILHTRGWLAMMAARRVLPLYEEAIIPFMEHIVQTEGVPEDHPEWVEDCIYLPRRLLDLSQKWIDGKADDEEMHVKEDEAYYHFGLFERSNFPFNAEMGGYAAYKAIGEVYGLRAEPFKYAQYHSKVVTITSSGKKETFGVFGSPERRWEGATGGEDFMDVDWSYIAATGDTAGTAAVASAYGKDESEYDPQKLLDFWTWWFIEAIPTAWERGHQ